MQQTPYPQQRSWRTPTAGRGAYDALVVGGGPAGLSAAIYLARFNRSVLVVDAGEGRSTSHETNENYLGFPRGIRSRDLRERGCRQAARFGAEFLRGRVTSVRRDGDEFIVRAGRRRLHARAVILATGVVDDFPAIRNIQRYVGVSLFWCITCDGWKARGKRIVLVGNSDEAATTALQFMDFTPNVTLITNSDRVGISRRKRDQLADAGIPLVRARVAGIEGAGARIRGVRTSAQERLPLDMLFSVQGAKPNVELAKGLGLRLEEGYIKTDAEQRTNIRHVYAAGDVTKAFAHQVVTAAHEGATAGQAANYDLYRPEQRAS